MLEIKKEDFDKLPQLDRIEFRQRYAAISEAYDYNIIDSFMFFLVGLSLFFWAVALLAPVAYGDEFVLFMLYLSTTLAKLFVLYAVAKVAFVLVYTIKNVKEKKKLIQEYFKISTAKGERKK